MMKTHHHRGDTDCRFRAAIAGAGHVLTPEFQENPGKIWESNIFGKSLHELVNEGLHNKLYRMPVDARDKVRETIERIINEGCNGLICIIL
ncbi:MAG: sporulation stage IV protein A [Anaeromassilibacillus sp.]